MKNMSNGYYRLRRAVGGYFLSVQPSGSQCRIEFVIGCSIWRAIMCTHASKRLVQQLLEPKITYYNSKDGCNDACFEGSWRSSWITIYLLLSVPMTMSVNHAYDKSRTVKCCRFQLALPLRHMNFQCSNCDLVLAMGITEPIRRVWNCPIIFWGFGIVLRVIPLKNVIITRPIPCPLWTKSWAISGVCEGIGMDVSSLLHGRNWILQVPALMLDCDTNIDFSKDIDAKTE